MIPIPEWMKWSAGSVIAWTAMGILQKVAIGRMGWQRAAVADMLTETILILAVCSTVRPQPTGWSWRAWMVGITAGVAGGVGYWMYMRALSVGAVSVVRPVVAANYVLAAVFGVVLFGERLTGSQTLGVVLVLTGLMLTAR